MFDTIYSDTVTLRRPKVGSLGVNGQPELEAVLDTDGTELVLRCRFESKGRKTIDNRGAEIRTDATLLYRISPTPVLQLEDFVVRKDRTGWKVVDIETQSILFGGAEYGRAGLMKTERTFPLDKDAYSKP